jgi:hypothetical protein
LPEGFSYESVGWHNQKKGAGEALFAKLQTTLGLFLDFFLLVLFVVFLFFFGVGFVFLVGNNVYLDGLGLGHFQLHFTFRASQDFAFFHFVLFQIDDSAAFGTSDHVETSSRDSYPSGGRIIYLRGQAFVYTA